MADTATFQVNADAEYEISNISLAAGTTLALPANSDGTFTTRSGIGTLTLPSSGTVNLVIDGEALSRGTYTLFDSVPSGYDTKIALSGTAIGTSASLVDDGTSLQLLVGAVTVAWKADAGGDIGDAANWEGGVLPQAGDKLDFSAIATSGRTLTGSIKDAETGEDVVFSTATFADLDGGYVMLAGSLHLSTLVNAENLAIGTTGSLVIEGDLVRDTSSSYAENSDTGRLLYSNQGSVTVKGKVVGSADDANLAFYQYRSTKINGTTYTFNPIRTGGISYYSEYGKTLTFKLRQGYSSNKAPGEFVIGSDGVSISSRATGDSIRYTVDSGCTFHSDADWEFGMSNRSRTTKGDIYVTGATSTLTFDTSDYDSPSDASKAHTITMTGRIYAPETSGTGVQVSGNGTFVINTASGDYGLQETCISNTLAVVDSATLQLCAGAAELLAECAERGQDCICRP